MNDLKDIFHVQQPESLGDAGGPRWSQPVPYAPEPGACWASTGPGLFRPACGLCADGVKLAAQPP